MQTVPLKLLKPYEKKKFTLDLVNSLDPNDPLNNQQMGQIEFEMTFVPFQEDSMKFASSLEKQKSENFKTTGGKMALQGAGLLLVTVVGADDVEGKTHTNPYAVIHFRGEERKTKVIHAHKIRSLAFSNSDHMFKVLTHDSVLSLLCAENQEIPASKMGRRIPICFRRASFEGTCSYRSHERTEEGSLFSV